MKQPLEVWFQSVTVRKPHQKKGQGKELPDPCVTSIGKKQLLISSKHKVSAKELRRLQVTPATRSLQFTESKDGNLIGLHEAQDEASWQALLRYLAKCGHGQALRQQQGQGDETPAQKQFAGFLRHTSPANQRRGGAGRGTTMPTNARNRQGVFGSAHKRRHKNKHASLVMAARWSDDDEQEEEDHGAAVTTPWDDDNDEPALGSAASPEEEVPGAPSLPEEDEPLVAALASDEDDHMSLEEDEPTAAPVVSTGGRRKRVVVRGRLTKMKRRASVENDEAIQEDSDSDLDTKPTWTTPAAQTVVTPATLALTTTTSTQQQPKKKQPPSLEDDNEDKKEQKEEEETQLPGQQNITSFFKHKSETAVIAAKTVSTPTRPSTRVSTPARRPKGTTPRLSASKAASARLIRSAIAQDHFLTTTPPPPESPAERRSRQLGLFSAHKEANGFDDLWDRDRHAMPPSSMGEERRRDPPQFDLLDRPMPLDQQGGLARRGRGRRRRMHQFGSSVEVPMYKRRRREMGDAESYDHYHRPLYHRRRFGSDTPSTNGTDLFGSRMSSWSSSQSPPFVRGLCNLGNTCYLNSSLQMLLTLPAWAQRLDSAASAIRSETTAPDALPLTTSVVRTANQLAEDDNPMPVNPRPVKEAIDGKTSKFEGFEQRDAHEFLTDLIDNIHEELEEPEPADNDGDISDKNKTESVPLPTDDFSFTVQVCLECSHCGYKRTRDEIYKQLSINIVKENDSDINASVEKGLEYFFQPETREVKCEKCEHGVEATQTHRILSKPKALLLHLKRFVFEERAISAPTEKGADENKEPNSPKAASNVEYVFRKNKDPIALSPQLSLDRFFLDEAAASEEQEEEKDKSVAEKAMDLSPSSGGQFELQALVHHIGQRPSSGHYVADAVRLLDKKATTTEDPNLTKEKELRWVTFDDGRTKKTSLEDISTDTNKQKTAYMMLYKLSEKK